MSMLENIRTYKEFLQKQIEDRNNFLEIVSTKIVDGLTEHLNGWGWERKGKSGGLYGDKIKGVKYTKNFNGKSIVIEYRNNLRLDNDGLYYSGGYNEFIHNKEVGNSIEVFRMTQFYWNGETESGCNLDEVLQRMEDFYSK
jgi:hypothetical protein